MSNEPIDDISLIQNQFNEVTKYSITITKNKKTKITWTGLMAVFYTCKPLFENKPMIKNNISDYIEKNGLIMSVWIAFWLMWRMLYYMNDSVTCKFDEKDQNVKDIHKNYTMALREDLEKQNQQGLIGKVRDICRHVNDKLDGNIKLDIENVINIISRVTWDNINVSFATKFTDMRNDDIDDNDKQDIVFYEKLDTTNTSRFIVKSVLMADSEMMLFTNDKVFINTTEVTDDSKIIGSLSNVPNNNKRLHILSNKYIEDKEKSFIHFITGIDMKNNDASGKNVYSSSQIQDLCDILSCQIICDGKDEDIVHGKEEYKIHGKEEYENSILYAKEYDTHKFIITSDGRDTNHTEIELEIPTDNMFDIHDIYEVYIDNSIYNILSGKPIKINPPAQIDQRKFLDNNKKHNAMNVLNQIMNKYKITVPLLKDGKIDNNKQTYVSKDNTSLSMKPPSFKQWKGVSQIFEDKYREINNSNALILYTNKKIWYKSVLPKTDDQNQNNDNKLVISRSLLDSLSKNVGKSIKIKIPKRLLNDPTKTQELAMVLNHKLNMKLFEKDTKNINSLKFCKTYCKPSEIVATCYKRNANLLHPDKHVNDVNLPEYTNKFQTFTEIYSKIEDKKQNCPADLSSSNNSDAGTEMSDMIKEEEKDDSPPLMITNGDENLNSREIPDNDESPHFTGTATIISDNTGNLSPSIATTPSSSTPSSSTTPSTTTLSSTTPSTISSMSSSTTVSSISSAPSSTTTAPSISSISSDSTHKSILKYNTNHSINTHNSIIKITNILDTYWKNLINANQIEFKVRKSNNLVSIRGQFDSKVRKEEDERKRINTDIKDNIHNLDELIEIFEKNRDSISLHSRNIKNIKKQIQHDKILFDHNYDNVKKSISTYLDDDNNVRDEYEINELSEPIQKIKQKITFIKQILDDLSNLDTN